jgi:hypothetical protein
MRCVMQLTLVRSVASMQLDASKEGAMRLRPPRNPRRALALDPRKVTVSEGEILDDLLYPARARRIARRTRR